LSNNNLNILGIKRYLIDKDIQNEYRKLAMKYHPDRNNDRKSYEIFIRINEIYASQSNLSILYKHKDEKDKEFLKRISDKKFTKEEFQDKIKWAKSYCTLEKLKNYRAISIGFIQFKKSFMNLFSFYVSLFSIIIASLLLLDFYLLPKQDCLGVLDISTPEEQLDDTFNDVGGARKLPVKNTQVVLKMYSEEARKDSINKFVGKDVEYSKTYIFSVITDFKIDNNNKKYKNLNSVSEPMLVFIIFLYLPIITLLFRGPNPIFLMSAYISTCFALFTFFILIIQILIPY